MTNPAINLQTLKGVELYYELDDKYHWSKETGNIDWFINFMTIESVIKERKLNEWAEKNKMDMSSSKEVWDYWKEHADEVACMAYFAKRK